MFDQSAAGLNQPLLQAGQRPLPDRRGQRQPSPQIAEIIGDNAQPQPHLVSPKAVTGKPRHRDRLLAFLYPLLGSATLVVEAHHRPIVERLVSHDKGRRGETTPRNETRPSPPRAWPASNSLPDRESSCTGSPACGS